MNELRPKLFDVMKGYTKEQLIKDILSGIIVAIIALPLSIALAIASGVGPVQGLYTAIVAGFFISFFGGLCIWWRKQADRTFGSGWHRGKRRMC